MYSTVWFTKPGVSGDCLLISRVPTALAVRLVENLSEEFPTSKFWMEVN